jgi:hypothetical protein
MAKNSLQRTRLQISPWLVDPRLVVEVRVHRRRALPHREKPGELADASSLAVAGSLAPSGGGDAGTGEPVNW